MCGIIVHDGTIDSDYWGVVCVVLFNLSNKEYTLEAGNRIAQLIIELCFTPKFVKVSKFMDKKTEQGEKCFGSSGVWYTLNFVFLPLKKANLKMESKYFNSHVFEIKLYHYRDIADRHYKLLNILSLIFDNSDYYCFCDKYQGCEKDYHIGRDLCPLCYIKIYFHHDLLNFE